MFCFTYLIFHRAKTDKEVQEILAPHILASVGLRQRGQKILDWEDKAPEAARLRAMEFEPEAVRCQDFKGHVKISQKQIPVEAN